VILKTASKQEIAYESEDLGTKKTKNTTLSDNRAGFTFLRSVTLRRKAQNVKVGARGDRTKSRAKPHREDLASVLNTV
jgi:hypothetical protein